MLSLLKKLNPKGEPVATAVIVGLALLTVYKVLGPEKMPLTEVLSEDYATYVAGLFTLLMARTQVFTKGSKDTEVEMALIRMAETRTNALDKE